MRKKSVSESQLSREQEAMEKLWEEHLASEFKSKSAEAAINTMVERPSVNHVPVMTGGVGRKQLTHFYDNYFIPQMPPDTQIIPVSRYALHIFEGLLYLTLVQVSLNLNCGIDALNRYNTETLRAVKYGRFASVVDDDV